MGNRASAIFTRYVALGVSRNVATSNNDVEDTQDEYQKLGELCNNSSSEIHKKNFSGEELICFTEKDNN